MDLPTDVFATSLDVPTAMLDAGGGPASCGSVG